MKRAPFFSALVLALAVVAAPSLSACGAANVTSDPDRNLSPSDRSHPPERSSADETDGPTAPRGSAQRPIGEGAGYDEHDEHDEHDEGGDK